MHVIAWIHCKRHKMQSTRYKSLFLLFCILYFPVFAYSDNILSIADDLSSRKLYDDAITEYKRFIFFNPDSPQTAEAYYKIGLCYRSEGKIHNAIEALDNSISLYKDSELANRSRLTLATTLIASQNYNLAKLELTKIINSTNDESLLKKALYFYGIEAIYTRDWRSARDYFSKFYQRDDSIDKINSIIKTTERSYKSPTKAKAMSAIIPGAGQIYSGNWKNGINAFILNGAIIGGIAYNVYKKDYDNALIIAYLLLLRYYRGNIYHAGKDAERYNQRLDDQTADNLIRIVSIDEP